MSETIVFDRRKGFVALPVEVLELELSPGAFRLLVELCRMANLDGFCWPSLGQLGERLGRSKAAISGYITALRKAELISTETQTTAGGYNYRLRYCVVFWKAWRASLSGNVTTTATHEPAQTTERSVQPNERPKGNKNHIHLNQDPSGSRDCNHLVSEWMMCTKGAPYPALRHPPSAELVTETQARIAGHDTQDAAQPAAIEAMLSHSFGRLRIKADQAGVTKLSAHMLSKRLTGDEVQALCAALENNWQAHWRKTPSQKYVDQIIKTAQIVPRLAQKKVLEGYLKRWALAQKTLRPETRCEKLPMRPVAPVTTSAPTYIRGYN